MRYTPLTLGSTRLIWSSRNPGESREWYHIRRGEPGEHSLTLDLVQLTGMWSPADLIGVLTLSASTNPLLDHYSVRTSPGSKYNSPKESVVAEISPGTLTFSTLEGLAARGASGVFKA